MSREGFWAIEFQGAHGRGMGMLTLDTGLVVGADAGGVIYDGTYEIEQKSGDIVCRIECKVVEDGTWLVQNGQPVPKGTTFDIVTALPANMGERRPVTIRTQLGPVAVTFRKIRGFPN